MGVGLRPKEFFECPAKVDAYLLKSFGKHAPGLDVDFLDDVEQLGFGGNQVAMLFVEKVITLFQFLEFLNGIEIDWAH